MEVGEEKASCLNFYGPIAIDRWGLCGLLQNFMMGGFEDWET
jgi:hypothetical protein